MNQVELRILYEAIQKDARDQAARKLARLQSKKIGE